MVTRLERRRLLLHRFPKPIGLQLGSDLRHIVAKHDDIVRSTGHIADMVTQECFGFESQIFEQRNRSLLIDRHLHHQLFET